MFAKLKKCNCLERSDFNIQTAHLGTVKRDVIEKATGDRVGTETQLDVVDAQVPVKGFINHTGKKIYIKCYRKAFFEKRNVYEYIDESFIVYPGDQIMPNFRRQPYPGESLELYSRNEFTYLGQFCNKKDADCK